jgi:hypothetical protein
MTKRTLVFDRPFLLGFEHIRMVMERAAKCRCIGDAGEHVPILRHSSEGFQRTFVPSDGMQVKAAALQFGLPHIDIVRPEPARQLRTIPICIAG